MTVLSLLRAARITRHLPWLRGLELLRRLYADVLPFPPGWTSRIDDFDGNLRLDVDPREFIGIQLWHRPELFEREERRLFCSAIVPGTTVLDVGANIGIYTLIAAKRGARVFAVEGDPKNAARLRHHVALNGFSERVIIFECAAADRNGTLTLFRNPINCGGSNCFGGLDPVPVRCRTIDSLNLPPIDICKMDIEGAELSALRGMTATIDRSPGLRLLIEYNPKRAPEPLVQFLRSTFADVSVAGGGRIAANRSPSGLCNLWLSGPRASSGASR
jgi:FkbM family methyltransferase